MGKKANEIYDTLVDAAVEFIVLTDPDVCDGEYAFKNRDDALKWAGIAYVMDALQESYS